MTFEKLVALFCAIVTALVLAFVGWAIWLSEQTPNRDVERERYFWVVACAKHRPVAECKTDSLALFPDDP